MTRTLIERLSHGEWLKATRRAVTQSAGDAGHIGVYAKGATIVTGDAAQRMNPSRP
jgi:hypothetical protein